MEEIITNHQRRADQSTDGVYIFEGQPLSDPETSRLRDIGDIAMDTTDQIVSHEDFMDQLTSGIGHMGG